MVVIFGNIVLQQFTTLFVCSTAELVAVAKFANYLFIRYFLSILHF